MSEPSAKKRKLDSVDKKSLVEQKSFTAVLEQLEAEDEDNGRLGLAKQFPSILALSLTLCPQTPSKRLPHGLARALQT